MDLSLTEKMHKILNAKATLLEFLNMINSQTERGNELLEEILDDEDCLLLIVFVTNNVQFNQVSLQKLSILIPLKRLIDTTIIFTMPSVDLYSVYIEESQKLIEDLLKS
jgi:hypothetical protein